MSSFKIWRNQINQIVIVEDLGFNVNSVNPEVTNNKSFLLILLTLPLWYPIYLKVYHNKSFIIDFNWFAIDQCIHFYGSLVWPIIVYSCNKKLRYYFIENVKKMF